ncbi:pyridoxal phosphate-dependent decarboxylase family protein [Reinekea sp.]|uniref:pyridoxal phosphate-dependent decarboxylase family protein n=1 Tax=Reinekea sp. TaxID=1970455 RepID=UPI00398919C8
MKDKAETRQLTENLQQIGKALDQYLKYEHPDALHPSANWRSILNEPVPFKGAGLEQVVSLLTEQIIPNGSAVSKPTFTSYITTGGTTAATLAATSANIASPQRYMQTAFNFLEGLALEWLAQMFGLKGMQGLFSSGGSVANLVALGGARQHAFEQIGIDPAAEGVSKSVVIYASSECHHTIQRAAGVLGLGRRCVRSIDIDYAGRLNFDSLKKALEQDLAEGKLPIAIVANAGTTNRGAIDPIKQMGQLAKAHNIWFHIDGAYGLPGVLDERLAKKYEGLEYADSIIVDPHKWLGAAIGVGATFVKDRSFLARAFTQEPADYLEGTVDQSVEASNVATVTSEHSMDHFGTPYFDYGVELSSPSRGVVVWAMLKEIGVEGMRERIKRHNDMATELAQRVTAHQNLELLGEPELSICCFRYTSSKIKDLDAFNQKLHRQLIRGNIHLPSTTRVNGALAIRPCFIGARTEAEHGRALVDAVLAIGDAMINSAQPL